MQVIRILTLITALFSGVALAADSAQATPPVSLTGEKAVAQLKESGQYDSIAAAYEAARHAVRADEAEPDGVLHAQNLGHGLSASFDRHGLQLLVQRHGSEGERLTTRWRLDSVGRDGAVEKVPAGDALRRDGQRAEIVRDGLGLTEWFVNRPSGLEHGFTLDRRPAGEGALRLDIAIEGDLSPVPAADGQRIELHDAAGAKVLDYDKLRVWDAAGQELPARMEQAAAGGLRFRVEDAGARYPLTIDPTFNQQAYLKASNAGAADGFGWSVAVSGDNAVIGAFSESSNATTVNGDGSNNLTNGSGAAYVFTRSGTSWSQQAYLKASNTGAYDLFGSSVAVDGDTAVIGAQWEDSNANTVNGVGSDASLTSEFGAAYVFTRSGGTWSQQAYLKAHNSGTNDQFGVSVALSGDTAVIGASRESSNATTVNGLGSNNSASSAGAAYTFTGLGPAVAVPPTVTAISPTSGSTLGGTSMTITGTGFTGATSVTIGGAAATSVVVVDATTLTATTPAGSAGSASVLVTTPDGTNAANTFYTYVTPPGINVIFTDNGTTTTASFSGNLDTTVLGNPADLSSLQPTPSIFPFRGGLGKGGNVKHWTNVTFNRTSGGAGGATGYGTAAGLSGAPLQQGGNEFAFSPSVNYLAVSSLYTSGTLISGTVVYPNMTVAGLGIVDTEYTLPGDQKIIIRNGNPLPPPPTLTSVSPNSGSTLGGTVVTLTGTALAEATAVTIGGTAATSVVVVDATTLTCTTPPGSAGSASVLVTTRSGTNAANTLYTYVVPAPTVAAISPTSGSTLGGTSVTITGTGFTGATAVTIGGAAATSVIVVDATTLTATTPAGSAGSASVLVTTPGGTNAANTLYTYVTPPGVTVIFTDNGTNMTASFSGNLNTTVLRTPANSSSLQPTPSIRPSQGGFGKGGNVKHWTNVTFNRTSGGAGGATGYGTAAGLSGAPLQQGGNEFAFSPSVNYLAVSSLYTSGTPLSGALTYRNMTVAGLGIVDTEYTLPGNQKIIVRNGNPLPPPPTLTSVSPNSGTTAGGTRVTITGTALTGATSVTIGGVAAASVVVTATAITAITPAHAAGAVSVNVTTRGGTNAPNTLYTYVAPSADFFGLATDFTTGSTSNFRSVAVGDLNGDGKPDLATANIGSDIVSILLGDGAGSFGTATHFPVGARPRSVAMGDFNGDGKPDLAVANFNSANVSILLGDGTGSLGAATHFTVGSSPTSVAVGDLNGDGKPDLAVAGASSNNVSILLGNGTGSFGAATNFPVGSSPSSVVVGDLNDDGKPDLAVANQSSNSVSILLGTAPTSGPTAAPSVTAILPASGNTTGGTSVTITGTNFTGATFVTIGGVAATNVSVINALTLTCITPTHAAGAVSVDISTPGGTNAANTLFTYNYTPPTFSGYNAATPYQTAATILLEKLMRNASGYAVSATSAGPSSTAGGTAVLQSGSILYTPANGFSGIDTFPVTITDALGENVIGTVTMTVEPGANSGGAGVNPPALAMVAGKVEIRFRGLPNTIYLVQRSIDGMNTWQNMTTTATDAKGVLIWADTSDPLPPSAFYRVRLP